MSNYKTKMAQFEKVSFEQFKKDFLCSFPPNKNHWDEDDDEMINDVIHNIYYSIELPKRSTSGSAGYDFHCPTHIWINVNEAVKIPTGIKCYMEDGWVLQLYPRSSYGFKYGVHLANSVGIVDADYYNNQDNEGHIFIELVNDSVLAKPIEIKKGNAFCQGIFVPYGVTYDDNANGTRVGGIGSTGR